MAMNLLPQDRKLFTHLLHIKRSHNIKSPKYKGGYDSANRLIRDAKPSGIPRWPYNRGSY
jgi:hypothetical protein